MLGASLIACLLASGLAGGGDAARLSPRAGLHASDHDVSFLLGADLGAGRLGVLVDGWIRPGYWKTLTRTGPNRWRQDRILRLGGSLGARVLLGDRTLGILPMAGLELTGGDIAGSSRNPEGEAVGWVGLGAAFLGHQTLAVRLAPQEGVLGLVRGEWAWNF